MVLWMIWRDTLETLGETTLSKPYTQEQLDSMTIEEKGARAVEAAKSIGKSCEEITAMMKAMTAMIADPSGYVHSKSLDGWV